MMFFLQLLWAADINKTLATTDDPAVYRELLDEVEASQDSQKSLQKTLLQKIIALSESKKSFEISKKIENSKDFVEAFFDITETVAKALEHEKSIDLIKEQLDDISDDIAKRDQNSTDLLSLQLEYAYYYKKMEKFRKESEEILSSYRGWLEALLSKLDTVSFDTEGVQKRVKELKKKIESYEKRLKKLKIEKERWRILGRSKYEQNVQKEIQRIKKTADSLRKRVIKERSNLFFEALKQKSEKAFEIKNMILKEAEALKESYREALESTTGYAIEKRLGRSAALFYETKETIMAFMTQNRVMNVPLYKIAAGIGIFLFFLFLRKLFVLIVLKVLRKITAKTKSSVDDAVLAIVSEPLKFAFVILGFYLAVRVMGVESQTVDHIVRSMIIAAIFWLFFEGVSVMESGIYNFAKKFGKELYREIGSFFVKSLKIFIFSVGFVAVLQEWDINVSAFIASLGLGGLAFALAAKDTAANLFGGLTILADKSLKIDDWIRVNGVEGTVEDIGLRTIKVRTFEKSLVTVPNQIVANNPIENFSRREIRRIKMRIGLTYDTTKEQMERVLLEIRQMLKNHPGIDQNATMLVNFDLFEDSSLSIFIYCFTNTANWQRYLEIREDVNIKIMEIVENAGCEFAFPSQSLYIEKLPESAE